MLRPLMWLRFCSLMALPALGSLALLHAMGPASTADALMRGLRVLGIGIVPVIVFIGFTASVFSFPTRLPKALAVTFFTPAMMLLASVVLGWGPALFVVDECFAEIGGMGLGAAAAALVGGGGGLAVRILGAAVFGGGALGAGYLFGSPMFELGGGDPVWIGLNAVAIAWSGYVFFEVFSFHARRTEAEEAAAVPGGELARSRWGGAAEASDLRRPSSIAVGRTVVISILGWIVAVGVGVVWSMQG